MILMKMSIFVYYRMNFIIRQLFYDKIQAYIKM